MYSGENNLSLKCMPVCLIICSAGLLFHVCPLPNATNRTVEDSQIAKDYHHDRLTCKVIEQKAISLHQNINTIHTKLLHLASINIALTKGKVLGNMMLDHSMKNYTFPNRNSYAHEAYIAMNK